MFKQIFYPFEIENINFCIMTNANFDQLKPTIQEIHQSSWIPEKIKQLLPIHTAIMKDSLDEKASFQEPTGVTTSASSLSTPSSLQSSPHQIHNEITTFDIEEIENNETYLTYPMPTSPDPLLEENREIIQKEDSIVNVPSDNKLDTSTRSIQTSTLNVTFIRVIWRSLVLCYSQYFANSHLLVYVHLLVIVLTILLHVAFMCLNLFHLIILPWESTMPVLVFNLVFGLTSLFHMFFGILSLALFWRIPQTKSTRSPSIIYFCMLILLLILYPIGIMIMREIGSRALTQPNGAVLDGHISYFLRKYYLWFISITGIVFYYFCGLTLLVFVSIHIGNLYYLYKHPERNPTTVIRVQPQEVPLDAI